MTPFGHVGGGILVAAIAERAVLHSQLAPLAFGAVALLSLLPDIDGLAALLTGMWHPRSQMLRHHAFPTHTPLYYLILAGIAWVIVGQMMALLVLVMALLHLLSDSWGTDDGIMWLWPLSSQRFSFFGINLHEGGVRGVQYYLRYIRCWRVVLPEAVLFVGGVTYLLASRGVA